MLLIPAAGPRGSVLDLRAQGGAPAATDHEPGTIADPGAPEQAQLGGVNAAPVLVRIASPERFLRGIPSSDLLARPTDTRVPSPAVLSGYVWPLAHPRLTLPFGPTPWGSRVVDGQTFHDGADLATFCGDRVTAAHDGTVIAAGRHYDAAMGWLGDLGPYLQRLDHKQLWKTLPIVVVIDDGNGYRSMYAHFERIVVKKDQQVHAGELLGYEGMTGRATGCHVHYGLYSPLETKSFRILADVAKRMKLPKLEIARIDPLLVLPPKAGLNAPKHAKSTPADSGQPRSP